jgi:rSAM/selenodomain-associated transferase 2
LQHDERLADIVSHKRTPLNLQDHLRLASGKAEKLKRSVTVKIRPLDEVDTIMTSTPAISIIVPVYNEEATIGRLLDNLDAPGFAEVIVVDGGSTDRTAEVASPRAHLVRSRMGRAAQMIAGAGTASGEIFLFLHADVLLGKGALDQICQAMADATIVGGNLDIRYEGKDWAARAFTRINRWRRRWGIFYGDSGIFCRRSVFEQLGGYQLWPIMEDYDFARRLSKAGRLAFLESPIWVSDRRCRKSGLLRTMWSWSLIQVCIRWAFRRAIWPDSIGTSAKIVTCSR